MTENLEIGHTLELFSENTDSGATIDLQVKFSATYDYDPKYGADADGNRGMAVESIEVEDIKLLIDIMEMRKDKTFYLKNKIKAQQDGYDISDFIEAFFPDDYKEIKEKCEEHAAEYFAEMKNYKGEE